ncbi:hypothetical protein EDD85DRAFT_962376 [Armillaria nabsnona]|nr:hypothetical protein EDD85DRAFT_962376 [Armillaria nabsnona]
MSGSISPLFHKFRTLPSTNLPKLMTSKLSAQPTSTGEVLTNPKVVNSVTATRISLSVPWVTANWHGNADVLQSCLTRPYVIKLHTQTAPSLCSTT